MPVVQFFRHNIIYNDCHTKFELCVNQTAHDKITIISGRCPYGRRHVPVDVEARSISIEYCTVQSKKKGRYTVIERTYFELESIQKSRMTFPLCTSVIPTYAAE